MFLLCSPPKMLSKQTQFWNSGKRENVFWILFQFSLRVVNDMGNCVPHACHSLHPIDWELNTQKRAVGRVTVYLWWWLQPINFDGCHFIEKTMGVGDGGDAACFLSPTCVHKNCEEERRGANCSSVHAKLIFGNPNETTSALEVIECHFREADPEYVSQDARAWFPCDLQRTARTRGSNITTSDASGM